MKTTKRVYRLLQLSGYARVDFRLDTEGRPYFLEANPNAESVTARSSPKPPKLLASTTNRCSIAFSPSGSGGASTGAGASLPEIMMSALGQKPTSGGSAFMSASCQERKWQITICNRLGASRIAL